MAETTAKRPVRRRGRWTWNTDSIKYGEAGWHLDGTPLVIDFMPGHGYDNKGEYQIYNDPCVDNHTGLDRYMVGAMEWAEEHWDAEHAREGTDASTKED